MHTLRMAAAKLSPDCPSQADLSGTCWPVRRKALTDRSKPRCLCPTGLLRSDCHGDTGKDLQFEWLKGVARAVPDLPGLRCRNSKPSSGEDLHSRKTGRLENFACAHQSCLHRPL